MASQPQTSSAAATRDWYPPTARVPEAADAEGSGVGSPYLGAGDSKSPKGGQQQQRQAGTEDSTAQAARSQPPPAPPAKNSSSNKQATNSASSDAAPGPAAFAGLNPRRSFWACKVWADDAARLTGLVHAVLAETGRTQHAVKQEFHATLLFMGRDRSKEGPLVPLNGRTVTLTVQGIVVTDRLACCGVTIGDPEVASACHNEYPHLTLALAPGVAPKESNDVLTRDAAARAAAEPLPADHQLLSNFPGVDEPLVLHATVCAM